jgi:hypothetical protein
MKNFKINFPESDRNTVLSIISRSNDVVLNQVEPESAFVTIQLEDDDADLLYESILSQIDMEIRSPQTTIDKPNYA